MKTYLIDWNGSYGIGCGNNDEDMVSYVDGQLADPLAATRIRELTRFDVIDFCPNGKLSLYNDSAREPKWFTLSYFGNKLKRKYLDKFSVNL